MSDFSIDFVCVPAKCMKTSKDFFVECYMQIAVSPGQRGRNTRPVRAIIGGRQVA